MCVWWSFLRKNCYLFWALLNSKKNHCFQNMAMMDVFIIFNHFFLNEHDGSVAPAKPWLIIINNWCRSEQPVFYFDNDILRPHAISLHKKTFILLINRTTHEISGHFSKSIVWYVSFRSYIFRASVAWIQYIFYTHLLFSWILRNIKMNASNSSLICLLLDLKRPYLAVLGFI